MINDILKKIFYDKNEKLRGSPSQVKGVETVCCVSFRSLSRRGSWVQIPLPAPRKMKKHRILLISFSIWILDSDYLCRKKSINEYSNFVFYVILNISFYLFFADAITRVTFCDVSLRFVLSIGKLTFPLVSGAI
jgi:hypothetical protein